jgi:hypothetical protein
LIIKLPRKNTPMMAAQQAAVATRIVTTSLILLLPLAASTIVRGLAVPVVMVRVSPRLLSLPME